MQTQHVFTNLAFGKWKQEGRSLKRSSVLSHNQALEQVAKSKGFESWHHLSHEAKQNWITETAFRSGLIVAYSLKDAMDSFDPSDIFVEDWRAYLFCEPSIRTWYATNNVDDELDEEYRRTLASANDPDEPDDWDSDVCLFRFCGSKLPATPRQVLPILGARCFFAPLFFWHKGRFVDPWQDLAINRVLDMSGGIAGDR